jgi:hypothetical protein
VTRPELRIGDQERDAAVSALGEHYAAGRLTKEEYDERSEVAWKARTNSDLAPLFVDLPPLGQAGRAVPTPRQATALPTWPPQPSPSRSGGFRLPLLPMVLIVVGLVMLTDGWALPLLLLGAFLWLKAAVGRRIRARATTARSGGAGRSPW